MKFDVFVADDYSVYVLFLRAMWSETRREFPLHHDTGTASGADLFIQQRHDRKQSFFKSQLRSNLSLGLAQAELLGSLLMKINLLYTRDPEPPGRVHIIC